MVRTYVKKSQGPKYSETDLKNALLQVKSGRMTAFKAAKEFNVPYSTVYTNNKGIRGKIKKSKRRLTVFSPEVEATLANGIKTLEKWGFGLSRNEVLSLLGRFVKGNNLSTPFKNSTPGEDWFLGFKKRHNLSIKKPQSVEFARRKATDPFTIFGYFDLLGETLNTLGIRDKPGSIWNLDESGLCIDPTKTKVVGERGKSASRITSGPARDNTTVLLLANAAGEKAPPLIIYKGLHMWDQWCAPEGTGYPGTVYAASKKGWMEAEIFKNFFERTLIPSLRETRPALIIYDGHSTHVSPELIELAIRENITILKLPPHSSHLLQLLDLSVFKAFKDKWDAKLVTWQRQNVGRKLPKSIFSKFLGETWEKLSPEIIQSGFIRGGIYPFDKTVVPEEKFCPEALRRWRRLNTEKHTTSDPDQTFNATILRPELSTSLHTDILKVPSTSTASTDAVPESSTSTAANPFPEPSTSTAADPFPEPSTSTAVTDPVPASTKTFETLLLEMVKQSHRPEQTKRQGVGTGTEILTKNDVLERLKQKKEKEQKKGKSNKRHKKEVSSSEEEDENEIEYRDSDNEKEFLESLEHEAEIQNQEENYITSRDLDKDKWVLVKYTSKKVTKHFVGKINKPIEKDWEVKFLKRVLTKRRDTFKFEWSHDQDSDTSAESDIVIILPEPMTDRRGLFYFNVYFDGFNV